jgi:hypothetical protein
MKDVFVWLDQWNSRINFFNATRYWRITVTFLAFLSLIAWATFGFDSGIGMIQSIITDLPQYLSGQITFTTVWNNAYTLYGITGHFSAVVTYCLLFVLLSLYFERLDIHGSKNLFISLNLVFLNGALFELWYQTSYAIFQTPVYWIQWVTEFLGWYIIIFIGGIYTYLYFWANSFHSSFRSYSFKPTKHILVVIGVFIASMLAWWFYPGSFVQYGTRFFPQTVYAGLMYFPNDGVHLANIFVKSMFAITQYALLRQFRRTRIIA